MKGYLSKRFNGTPIGLWIRGSMCNTWTYRVRRGNGMAGTEVGEQIQDKYPYFVPRSIKNPEGQHSRDIFTAAVAAWQALAENIKAWWEQERKRLRLKMSGYNLFIRIYMEDNL